MDWVQYIAPILTAIGAVIMAWFTYNQRTKDKLTDLRIEKWRQEKNRESKRRSDNSSIIFGELWNILHLLNADRVYIVQPHPLGREERLSIWFEVKRKGVEPMKPHIQNLDISEVAVFNRMLTENLFLYLADIDKQVDDKYAKSILSSYGCCSAIIKRLSDSKHDRNGNIFCEFTRPLTISENEAHEVLHAAATNIQYILPPIDDEP